MAKTKGGDTVDKLVVFLAKRDGIDKLVKTFQYVFKLAHWRLLAKHPELAARAKAFEDSCGLSRKAFRTGRFLTAYNNLRHNNYPDWKVTLLNVVGSGGDMIYFLFDHLTWMSRVGLLDSKLAGRFAFVSAYGETFLYVAFMTLDVIMLKREREAELKLIAKLELLQRSSSSTSKPTRPSNEDDQRLLEGPQGATPLSALSSAAGEEDRSDFQQNERGSKDERAEEERGKEIHAIRASISAIRAQRISRVLSLAAQFADLVIAIAQIEPNPTCCHPLSLGVSGLVSAWAGWARLWG